MTDLFLSTLNMLENDCQFILTLISLQSLPIPAINTLKDLRKMLNDLQAGNV